MNLENFNSELSKRLNQPAPELVTWQKAIQAWADGKTIRLKTPEWEQVWKPSNAISFNHCHITQGLWYVED